MSPKKSIGRIRVHTIDHVRAALAAAADLDVPVILISAPGAAATLGPGYFREMIAAARADFPQVEMEAILDCGDAPGHALAALHAGIKTIRIDAPSEVMQKIADIAAQCDARLDIDDAPALDLLDLPDPQTAAADWLGNKLS